MQYIIYRDNVEVAKVRPLGSQNKQVMGANTVTMSFALRSFVEFQIGDYVDVYGDRYYLNFAPTVQEISSRNWRYQLELQAIPYDLIRSKFFTYDSGNQLRLDEFTLTANASTFIDLIITNVSRTQSGWTKGQVDATRMITLSFSNENCMAVLSRLAEEFNTEYWIDGKTIHLNKQGEVLPITLAYGKGNGLRSVERTPIDNNPPITRLYVYGAEKNIPADYRGYSKRLMLPVASAPNGYIEANTALYGIREEIYKDDDIYPHRLGTVTATSAINSITDTGLDFDINDQLVPGQSAKIVFNSGLLSGYTFDISSYNHTTKTITFKQNTDEKAFTVPSPTMAPAPGDQWVLIDVIMPQSYITAAEAELLQAGTEYLQQNSGPRYNYSLTTDPLHFQRANLELGLGKYITLQVPEWSLDQSIRIIGYSRDINKPYQYSSVEVSQATQINPAVIADTKQRDVVKTVSNTKKDAEWATVLAERVRDLTGSDNLPPGTTIITQDGYIAVNLLNADYIITRNFYTGKIRMTAAANNFRMVDEITNKIIMLLDDDSALEGVVKSQLPPITDDQGVVRDPDFLYQRSEVVGGADTMFYYYAKRGVGATFGTPGEAVTSIGRAGIFSTDTNGIIHMQRKLDLTTGRGYIRDNVYNGLIYESLINKTSGLRMSAQFKIQTIGGINYVVADEVQTEVERMYNPNVIADAGDNGNSGGGGGVILEPTDPTPTNPTTLKAKFPYNVGVAFKDALLNDTQYGGIVKTEFDQMTPENGCKFGKIRPNRATFNFNELDDNFNWAKANGLKVHLHYLLPGGDDKTIQWFLDMESLPNAAVEVEAEIRLHIKTVLQHVMVGPYAGMVVSIDIVNECLTGGGNVKDSMLKRLFGEQYIDIVIDECQKWAPGIPKLLNDFDFEYSDSKINGVIALRDRIASRGYTLDGIGSQMHSVLRMMTETPTSLSEFRSRIQLIADSGMMLHISELDVRCRRGTDGVSLGPYPFMTPELEAAQANFFVQVHKAPWEIMPQGKLLAVTVWSLDDNSNFENIPTMTDYTSIWYLENGIYKKRLAHQALLNMEIGTELEL